MDPSLELPDATGRWGAGSAVTEFRTHQTHQLVNLSIGQTYQLQRHDFLIAGVLNPLYLTHVLHHPLLSSINPITSDVLDHL